MGCGKRRLTDPQNLHGIERVAPAAETAEHDKAESGSTGAELEREEVLDVVEDALALLDSAEDGAEVIVGENHVCSFLGHVGAELTHANTDVSLLQRRSVVHAIASHGHDIATALQSMDDLEFVVGTGSCENGDSVHAFRELGFAHVVELVTAEDGRTECGRHIDRHAEPFCDGDGCDEDERYDEGDAPGYMRGQAASVYPVTNVSRFVTATAEIGTDSES